jgi:hypothetical protein
VKNYKLFEIRMKKMNFKKGILIQISEVGKMFYKDMDKEIFLFENFKKMSQALISLTHRTHNVNK